MRPFKKLDQNISYLKDNLPIEKSFDVIGREITICGRDGYFIFVDGFAKDDVLVHVLRSLQSAHHLCSKSLTTLLIKEDIAYIEAEECEELEKIEQSILSGQLALFIDQQEKAILIDSREYPVRSIEEADTEKVTNGSKDGFVETIVFNTALIRRRVRDKNLIFEMRSVGNLSKTDVCLAYLDGKAEPKFLDSLRRKLEHINVESLVMAEKSLEELLVKRSWYNPFPQMRYTQRPDIAVSYLYEGHVLILVDTSPSVMITPTTFFYYMQFAEDYIQVPVVGTYYKMARFLAFLISLLLVPSWFLLAEHPEIVPKFLDFIGTKEPGTFSLLIQFISLEFGFDLLKMSSMHTPTYLGGAFGIIGGLLLGDFAIKVGIFVPETIFYMALTAVASYCIPNSDLTHAIRILRFLLLILVGIFGIYGYLSGLLYIFILLLTTKTLDHKRPYLWPLIPLDIKALSNLIIRKKVSNKEVS